MFCDTAKVLHFFKGENNSKHFLLLKKKKNLDLEYFSVNIKWSVWSKSEKFIVFPKSKIFRPVTNPGKKPTKCFASSHLQSMRWDPQSQDSGTTTVDT